MKPVQRGLCPFETSSQFVKRLAYIVALRTGALDCFFELLETGSAPVEKAACGDKGP